MIEIDSGECFRGERKDIFEFSYKEIGNLVGNLKIYCFIYWF